MEAKSNTKIGGEFEINPYAFPGYPDYKPNNKIFIYSSGRSALIAILKHLTKYKKTVIHIPFYICHSVLQACGLAGFQIKFYELNENFLLPLDYLNSIKIGELLLTVNYFGFVEDNPTIKKIRKLRPDITIISDQVQSFWTYDKTEADYSFTSLRKHFPTPEGAFVYCKDRMIEFDNKMLESSFHKTKLIGSLLKYQGLPDNVYLKFFDDGEQELDKENSPSKGSRLAQYLYEGLYLADIKKKRRENYKFLYDCGLQNGLNFVFPYNETVTPLNVPIFLKNRDKVRMNLMEQNIFLPIHWLQNDFNEHSSFAKKMATTELSLVIDQRYSTEQIEFEVTELIKAIKND